MQAQVVDSRATLGSAHLGAVRFALLALLVFLATVWGAPPAVGQPSADCPAGTATYLSDEARTDRGIRSTIRAKGDYCLQTDGTATVTTEAELREEWPSSHSDNVCSGQQTMFLIWEWNGEGTATWSLEGNTLRIVGHEMPGLRQVEKRDCGGEIAQVGEETLANSVIPSFTLEMTASGGTLTGSHESAISTGTVYTSATLGASGLGGQPPGTTTTTAGSTGTSPPQATGPSSESGTGIPMAAVAAAIAALGVGGLVWIRSRRSSRSD